MTPEQRAAFEEAERIADMKFYMLQIYKIIKPVVVCIFLSILWVKVSMAGSDYRCVVSALRLPVVVVLPQFGHAN